jgi:hypothetical protein
MRIHEACCSGLAYPITRNLITLLLEPQVDTPRYGTLLTPSTMTQVSVQRHTTQNVRHTLHMIDTLRAHVLAVAHNLATYLCYNVCFSFTKEPEPVTAFFRVAPTFDDAVAFEVLDFVLGEGDTEACVA